MKRVLLCDNSTGLNSFYDTGLFLYPLKTLEKFWFSDNFMAYRNGIKWLQKKWVNVVVFNGLM